MGLEFLARVRRTSLWLGAVAALFSAVYASAEAGLGAAGGVAWSLFNLFLLEKLIVALTGHDRGSARAAMRAGLAALGLLALFGAGAGLLLTLPAMWLVGGFLVPYAVMVAKAASMILMESKLWARLAREPRRMGALMLIVAVAAWAAFAWAASSDAPTDRAHGETAVTQQAADAPGDDAHGTEEHVQDAHADDGRGAAHGEDPHGGGHGESEGPQKFANFITVISRAFPNADWAHFLHEFEVVIFALLFAAVFCIVAGLAAAKRQMIPGRFQNAVEMLFEGLHGFIVGILGEKHGPRFVPFLGSLFIYILLMNYAGLVPFLEAPTSNLNVTVALAVLVFLYAQFIGLRELGLVGWLDHLAGSPRSLIGWLMVPLMLPIHVLGELAKPISLSARLFGNVFGEDMLLVAFASLGVTVLSFTGLPFGLPLHLPFLFLALLTGAIQALIFTVLSTIYILLMLPHEEHEESHEEVIQPAH